MNQSTNTEKMKKGNATFGEKFNSISFGMLIIIFLSFFITHLTPKLAIKTHLFLTGHFKEAYTSDIQNSIKIGEESEYVSFYTVTPAPYEKKTATYLVTYKIEKVTFLYFASYYGEV